MKKSKSLFILAIVFLIITVGLIFYTIYCEQKNDDYTYTHIYAEEQVKLEIGEITQSEFDNLQNQRHKLDKRYSTARTSSIVSGGFTALFLVSSIVLFAVEKRK